jgi:hypothetical protein
MSAEKDGIMTTVNLKTVLDDYNASVTVNGSELKHRLVVAELTVFRSALICRRLTTRPILLWLMVFMAM